jgi:hypothetical protein
MSDQTDSDEEDEEDKSFRELAQEVLEENADAYATMGEVD